MWSAKAEVRRGTARAQLCDAAAGGSGQRPAGRSPALARSPPAVETAVDSRSLAGSVVPRPSMKALGSGLCAFALLAGLMGSVCPRALPSWGPGPAPPAPQNSSGGPVAGLEELSVRAPFLITLWTLVALSSLMGKRTASVCVCLLCPQSKLLEASVCRPVCWAFLVLFHDSLCLINILRAANGPPRRWRVADKRRPPPAPPPVL